MCFDLCEIERRKLENELKSCMKDVKQFDKIYQDLETRFQFQKTQYFKEVDRGTNEQEMKKWNDYIDEALEINNIALFKPFQP